MQPIHYFGAQTLRALGNFPISGQTMPARFVQALALIKAAAAKSNGRLGVLDAAKSSAIAAVASEIAQGQYADQFPVDVFQTGSGTSTNMNMNEVIAQLCRAQHQQEVHPNDHVNASQSSNDTIPSALQLAASQLLTEHLLPALQGLQDNLRQKAQLYSKTVKTGRTHLMDAVPMTLGQEMATWAQQIQDNISRLVNTLSRLTALPQGGTAIGTGLNAPPLFKEYFIQELNLLTGMSFSSLPNLAVGISAQDTAVELSGQLRVLAVTLMKMANDLRWMNSGNISGLSEISLAPLQAGSSIMPGKINPVIPESICMLSAHVIGTDVTIGIAGQAGQFQLNTMLPLMAYHLLNNLEWLGNGCRALSEKALMNFTVHEAQLAQKAALNPILLTALTPVLGYEAVANIIRIAQDEKRSFFSVAMEHSHLKEEVLRSYLDPIKMAIAPEGSDG